MSKARPENAAVALELVGEYARLQDLIHGTRKRIGDALELCPGIRGHRKEEESFPGFDGGEAFTAPTERAMADVTHLSQWYTPDNDGEGRTTWGEPDRDECPHCFAAHEVVQQRRGAKRQLGSVKGRMRKLGRKVNRSGETSSSASENAQPPVLPDFPAQPDERKEF